MVRRRQKYGSGPQYIYLQTVSNNRGAARFHRELPSNAQYAPCVVVINLIKVTISL